MLVPVSRCKSLPTQANEQGCFKQKTKQYGNNPILTSCHLYLLCCLPLLHKPQYILGQECRWEIPVFSSSRNEILLSVEEMDFVPSSAAHSLLSSS